MTSFYVRTHARTYVRVDDIEGLEDLADPEECEELEEFEDFDDIDASTHQRVDQAAGEGGAEQGGHGSCYIHLGRENFWNEKLRTKKFLDEKKN